jgi:predicted ester cyclase
MFFHFPSISTGLQKSTYFLKSHPDATLDLSEQERMPTELTPAAMKKFVIQHFEDFVNHRKAEVIHHNMTPDFYDHDGPGGKPAGVEGDEQMMRRMYQSMPDLQIRIEDILAEGDTVVCRNVWHWTDPGSGKQMQFHGFVQWRFQGNKIAERWATVTPPQEGEPWTRTV